jgi:hypothetical protein
MKKLVWTALVAGLTAAVSGLTFRLATVAWRGIMKERPPRLPRWAQALVGQPLRKRILGRLGAPVP